jgi:hypothetical protein
MAEENLDHIHDPQDPQEWTIADMTSAEAREFIRKAVAIMEQKKAQANQP